jgi:hypothetical protein
MLAKGEAGFEKAPNLRFCFMNLAASLIAISLILLAAVAVASLFMAGTDSRSANADDPPPRA